MSREHPPQAQPFLPQVTYWLSCSI